MQCPNCGQENPDGMKFCGDCGAPFKQRCPQCGFDNLPRFKFCGECGSPLALRPSPSQTADSRLRTPDSPSPRPPLATHPNISSNVSVPSKQRRKPEGPQTGSARPLLLSLLTSRTLWGSSKTSIPKRRAPLSIPLYSS